MTGTLSRKAPDLWEKAVQQFRRSPKKTGLLLALLPVLLLVWVPVLQGAPRPATTTTTATAGASPAAPLPVARVEETAPAVPGGPVDREFIIRRFDALEAHYAPRWPGVGAADPFAESLPVTSGTPHAGGARPPTEPAPRVAPIPSSIFLSQRQAPVAIIRGRAYRPGDTVGGFVIHAIEERRVLYRDGNETYAAAIPDPTVGKGHD